MLHESAIKQLKTALPGFDQLSKLIKKTAKESAGPCPLCGDGDDRFYVHDGLAGGEPSTNREGDYR